MNDQELEEQLWQMMRNASNGEIGRVVRISRLADQQLPVPNKKWVTDKVKSWDNLGLVVAMQNGAQAQLTEAGARKESLHE